MFLYRHILVVPVPVHGGDVGTGDHVDDLFEPETILLELFGGEKLHPNNGQTVKEVEASEGHQGPLCSHSSVEVVIRSFWIDGVIKIPSLTLNIKVK